MSKGTETITLQVGRIITGNSGQVQDTTRPVEFEGEKLATYREYGEGRDGVGITDSRGRNETLYKASDGRLVVYVENWSHWQGEPNDCDLLETQQGDFEPGGRFEMLGREAGMGRPLTLDEALNPL